MGVFDLRERGAGDYGAYVRSFTELRAAIDAGMGRDVYARWRQSKEYAS